MLLFEVDEPKFSSVSTYRGKKIVKVSGNVVIDFKPDKRTGEYKSITKRQHLGFMLHEDKDRANTFLRDTANDVEKFIDAILK